MTFADLPESATVGIMVRFSGIDRVFADFAQPERSGWGSASGTITIDGESYIWSQSVHMPRAIGMGSEFDPNKYRLTAGGLNLEFRMPGTQDPFTTNPWLSLLNKDPFRTDGDYAVLAGTLEADHTSAIDVVQTTGWATSGHIHVGIERIEYSTLTATTFGTPITRGTYGSKAQQHRSAFPGSLVGGSGAQVTLYPTVWQGRIATVHIVRGLTVDGVFVPDSTTPENELIDKLQRYVVVSAKSNGDNSLARVQCNSIDAVQDVQIAQRLPRSNAGLTDGEDKLIRLDDTVKNITYRWSLIDNKNQSTMDEPVISIRLQRDLGAGVPADVVAGWYTLGELAVFLTFSILQNLDGPSWFSWVATSRSRITLTVVEDVVGVAAFFDLDSVPTAATTDWQVSLSVDPARGDSVWRALGFEDPAQALSASLDTSSVQWSLAKGEATRKFPRFYLPRFTGTTLIRSWGIEDPQTPHVLPGYEDNDGNAVDGYLRISDVECVGFSAVDTATYPGYTAFTVSERGALGSSLAEIYVEWGDDAEPIVQGLAFPNTSWLDVLLYLLLGGSGVSGLNDATYDEGWVGSGIYVPAALVDKTSILALVTKLGDTLRDWAWFEATKLREFVDSEGLLANAIIAPITGQLVARAITKLLEAEAVDSVATLTLADQHADTGRRTYDDGENMISNALEIAGAWDHAANAPKHIAKTYQGTSVTSYGLRNKRSVKLQGVLSVAELKSRVEDLGIRYFSTRAFPQTVFGLPFAKAKVWDIELMDIVELTDDLLPTMSAGAGAGTTAARGLSAVACRVFKADHMLPASKEREAERGRLGFVTDKKDSSRYSHWAPAAQVNAVTGGGSTTLVCDDHSLSGDESTSLRDVVYFDTARAGSLPDVRIYPVGDYASSIVRQVQSVTLLGADLSEIEVDAAVALTPPLIVEPIEYTDADLTAEQKRYVYMSDGDHKLDKSSGSDLPFKYV
jgi:hypothetical protein